MTILPSIALSACVPHSGDARRIPCYIGHDSPRIIRFMRFVCRNYFSLKRMAHRPHYRDEWKKSHLWRLGWIHDIPTRKTLGDRGEAWDFRSPEPHGESGSGDLRVFAAKVRPRYASSLKAHRTELPAEPPALVQVANNGQAGRCSPSHTGRRIQVQCMGF
jgi:hypothetical protein